MKLQKFDGGISTRKEPYLINADEGQTYTNVNNDKESLQPVNAPLAAGQSYNNNHRYIKYSQSIVELDKTPTSFIEYKNKIYYSVDDDFVQMKDDNSEGDLGFNSPVIIPTDTITARPAAPVSGDITVTTQALKASFGFNAEYSGFAAGVTYHFAFQQEDDEGRLSDVLFYNWTAPNTGGTYFLALFNLPVKFRIYLKKGGVWRRAYGTSSIPNPSYVSPPEFWYFDAHTDSAYLVRIGTANVNNALSPGTFLLERSYEQSNALTFIPNLGVYWFGWQYVDSTGSPTGEVPLTIVTQSVAVDLDTITTDGVDLPNGTYYYLAEVHSTLLGWTSEPSNLVEIVIASGEQASLEITEAENTINQTGLDTDIRINQVRVYRLGGNFTDFTLIATIDNPEFPILFTDTVTEVAALGSPLLESEDYDKPLAGLKNLAIVGGQLCGTIGSKLYFSLANKPYAFPSTNFRDFREDLTGIYNIDAGLVVCSLNNTWLLNTSNLGVGKVIKISDEFGCTGHNTIAGYRTGAMWSSLYGIAASFGGKVELLTKDKYNYTNLNIVRADVHNETYWGFTEQNTMWALDLRFGYALKFFNFALFNDNLPDTVVQQVYRQDDSLRVLWGADTAVDSYELFGDTNSLATMVWKSPKFIEGSYSELKTYKDIFVRASGTLSFKVYIEDSELAGNLVANESFNGLNTYHIKVDSEALQGYAVWFEATGKGTIYEIEYKTMGRQSGR